MQELILFENRKSKNVFCDWINDADYLKRKLVCKATLKVIETRLEQSDAIILWIHIIPEIQFGVNMSLIIFQNLTEQFIV